MSAAETTAHLWSAPASRRAATAAGLAILAAVLQAHKTGELEQLKRRSPRLFGHLRKSLLQPVIGSLGAWQDGDGDLRALVVFLRWGLAQLRPDGLAHLADITEQGWLERTSWRPLLVLMCHFGFAPVPAFPARYRRRADESPIDNLCGLWSIGASSYYRYLEKGKRQFMQRVVLHALNARQSASLRQQAQEAAYCHHDLHSAEQRAAWHAQKAQDALTHRDLASSAWHLLQTQALPELLALIDRHSAEFAAATETDGLMLAADAAPLTRSQQAEMQLVQAALWRARNAPARELDCLEQARRLAAQPADPLMLGLAYAALGKHFEVRDGERSLACYEDSAQYLAQAMTADRGAADARAADGYVRTLVGIGWHHALKKDPRALAVLEQAQTMLQSAPVSPATAGLLEQALGEYWRRAGDVGKALRHKHRALNIFERQEDLAQMLSTYNNLGLLYCETREFERACAYAQKVIDLARTAPVDPYVLASSHGNLGIALVGLNDHDRAIHAYRAGLAVCEQTGLQTLIGRALYNLADAHYRRFQARREPEDERQGDAYAAASFKVWAAQKDKAAESASLGLKQELLGHTPSLIEADRLTHEEFVAHFDELRDVKQHRATLALPGIAQAHVQAHLAIAQAYLAVANKEREAAKALIARHGLEEAFAGAFERLHQIFHRERSTQERLLVHWQTVATDLLGDERRMAVLAELLRAGHINKSGYAQVCELSLATASKHLGLLAERGLLVQTGKGPATRYVLPDATSPT